MNRECYLDLNPSWDYFKFFITGKKSETMTDIERKYPKLDGRFIRHQAILHAIGCPSIHFKRGWLMFLPARQEFEFINKENVFHLSCFLFSLYIMKNRITDNDKGDAD